MNDEYSRALEALANRGQSRGAASVLEDARRRLGDHTSDYPLSSDEVGYRRPLVRVAFAVAAILLIVGVMAVLSARSGSPRPEGVASDGTSTTSEPRAESNPPPGAEDAPTDVNGWTAVDGPDPIGWVRTSFIDAATMGDVTEVVYSTHEELLGYWIVGAGYFDATTFESPSFDWRAAIRERFSPDVAEARIASIEAVGGIHEVVPA